MKFREKILKKMPEMLTLKSIITEKFQIFCKHSTIHGFYYFQQRRSSLIHAMWVLILISGLLLTIFLSTMIWYKFSVDPTFTVVQNTRYSTSRIQFPSVTVCDSELIYGPNTENVTSILLRRGYSKSKIEEFYSSITAISSVDFRVTSDIKKMHQFLQNLGYNYHSLLDIFKKPCEVLLLECHWRSKQFNCSDMFYEVLTFNGHCCHFDISYFKKNVPNDITFYAGVDKSQGLEIKVNTQMTSASGQLSDGYVRVFVLEKNETVTLADSSISVTSSSFFDVNVHVWSMDSSKDVKMLSVDSRLCLLKTDKLNGSEALSYNACVTIFILRIVVKNCRCLPFEYDEDIQRNAKEFQTSIDSNCLPKCDSTQYETETNSVAFQKPVGYSKVAVHFASNTCMMYRREILYTWDQMLANLGGIFGLCLGGSIISIIELIWFLIDLILTITWRMRHNKVKQATDKFVTKHQAKDRIYNIGKNQFVN